jgi:hypothetical protein
VALTFLVPGNKKYSDGVKQPSSLLLTDLGEGTGVDMIGPNVEVAAATVDVDTGVDAPLAGNSEPNDLLLNNARGLNVLTCKAGKLCCLCGVCGDCGDCGVTLFTSAFAFAFAFDLTELAEAISSSPEDRKSIKDVTNESSSVSANERGGGEVGTDVGTGEVQVEDTADPLNEQVEAIDSPELYAPWFTALKCDEEGANTNNELDVGAETEPTEVSIGGGDGEGEGAANPGGTDTEEEEEEEEESQKENAYSLL